MNVYVSTPVSSFSLFIPGKPRGKGRPRHGNGRTFTDAATQQAEGDIFSCWLEHGSPRLAEGDIELRVTLVVERPKSHYRKNGTLSAEGERHPRPSTVKPDVDNALKLVMDALNTRAWTDDVRVVSAMIVRLWCEYDEPAVGTRVSASVLP